MSVESMHAALYVDGLTATEKLVLIGIANHDGDGGAWPSKRRLARYAGISERQAQRIIATLAERGLIAVEANAGGTAKTRKDRRPNLYRLNLPAPPRGTIEDQVWLCGETPASTRNPGDGETSTVARGDIERDDGETPATPEPSSEPSDPNRPEDQAAPDPAAEGREAATRFWDWVKEHTGHAPVGIKFMALAKLIERFVAEGYEPVAVRWAVRRCYEDGRPYTLSVLEQYLDGRADRGRATKPAAGVGQSMSAIEQAIDEERRRTGA